MIRQRQRNVIQAAGRPVLMAFAMATTTMDRHGGVVMWAGLRNTLAIAEIYSEFI